MTNKHNIPYNLFAKFFSGEITENEQADLDKFVSENPDNKKILNDFESIWAAESEADKFSDKTESALNKIKKEFNREKKHIRPLYTRTIFRIAALFVIFLGLSYWAYNLFFEKEIVYAAIESKGQIISKELEDGSIIWLNKNSKLEYPKQFQTNSRNVKLKGEAFFIIEHNPDKPFIVETEFTKTEVLGTEFNLKANENDEVIELILVKGKVRFTDQKTKNEKTLIKNEKVILNKQDRNIRKTNARSSNFIAWKTNELNLNNLNLDQISRDLNEFFETEIIIDEDIKNEVFYQTLPFTNPKLKDILNTIKFSLNLTIDSTDKKIVIKK